MEAASEPEREHKVHMILGITDVCYPRTIILILGKTDINAKSKT